MELKEGVRLNGLRPEMLLGIFIVQRAYSRLCTTCVITSITDGAHSDASLHYSGCAVDFRTRNVPDTAQLLKMVRAAFGNSPDFDVILEVDHLHVEYQPKRRG